MKHLKTLLTSLVLMAQPLLAEDTLLKQYDRVLLTLHSGEQYEIGIDGESSLHSYCCDEGYYVIDVNGSGDYYYTFRRDEVMSIKFLESEDQSLGIKQLHVDADDTHTVAMRLTSEGVQFSAPLVGRVCRVRNLSGALMQQFVVPEANYCLSISDLPHGIYLVTVDGFTLKISL